MDALVIMFKQKQLIFFFLIVLLVNLSCNKRFAYLNKVKTPLKNGSVTFRLLNQSPTLLDLNFEKEVEDYCIKRLNKEGYNYDDKNPQYELILEMKVDSSLNFGIARRGELDREFEYAYSRFSNGIQLMMEVRYIKTDRKVWEDKYDLYYFSDYKRDLYRTKGVIKYMLSGINDTD